LYKSLSINKIALYRHYPFHSSNALCGATVGGDKTKGPLVTDLCNNAMDLEGRSMHSTLQGRGPIRQSPFDSTRHPSCPS